MDLIFLYLPTLIYLAQAAFTIWMMVDAYRRGAETFWYFIILFVQPIGAWAYFFVIKIRDLRVPQGPSVSVQNWLTYFTRPSLEELRFRAGQSPTFANHVALAERLMEKKLHAEAVPHLEAALERESEHGQVLYSLAKCKMEEGQPELAIHLLQKIQAKDKHWSNYAAWHLLIEAKQATGDNAGALATVRELAQLTHTFEHRYLLAEQLLANGLHEEARQLLDESLADYQFSPSPIRRRNRRWASLAKRLQKQVPAR